MSAAVPEPTQVQTTQPGATPASGSTGGAGGAGEPLLRVRGLRKHFPLTRGIVLKKAVGAVRAVDGVDLDLHRGETVGLVGESGCGKSTVSKLLVALEKPNSGSVTLGGVDVSRLSGGELRRKRRDLQLMFQDPHSSLDPRMRVGAIIGEPLAIQHLGSKHAQRDRVFELLTSQSDVTVIEVKDYITQPKPNGYKSLHAIVEVPVFLSGGIVSARVEVQFRTIAMDFWASLEHKIYYKYDRQVPQELLDGRDDRGRLLRGRGGAVQREPGTAVGAHERRPLSVVAPRGKSLRGGNDTGRLF